ncbi:MAG: hypothetical protein A2172_00630 [Candidatus Woykebacteria bacterium RBG_13_40_15]|uniref:Asparaginase n=1 Tax=Candidatus Woykebacteria bacterium RBG_13_40_15 TaxID=1802593 RepID=A0A1G1W9Q3_9BACT|nr:MAG: hypothetical protein A2172_00630 [Candidatus Woykebacteria bacterium RBG_13_40_15]
MKNKIAILGFGGTIAMVPNKEGTLVPAKGVDELISFVHKIKELADVTLVQLENLDSTNINPTHWTKLANKIAQVYKDYDGIIVIHGTDTMAYTAGAVALAVGKALSIPVVFTGSQLPMIETGTDAPFNLENSVKTVLQAIREGIAEVMIVFSDRVLRGVRAIKTSESKFGAFDSPAFPYLAQITATGVSFSPLALKATKNKTNELKINGHFKSDILAIDLVPGLEPGILRKTIKSGNIQALLLKSLGAGNVPSIEPYSFLPLIEEVVKDGIPVLISTKFVGGKTILDLYEPGKKALEAGAIPTGDMTDVMSQVKLMWLLGKGFTSMEDLKKEILTDYVGEISV